ncbi:hypothetical protein BW723_10405 [Polaribacter reichenbachii]|nr:DUF2291 domain-containing protein [Polaribacter reichenbachii]APZ48123.1 hypothetical protein BW723_10405 [Polaribacter reichenbachii]AUC20390.1 hypothetical protein BTO17_00850 [Polaribacter reichenbachii]
MKKSNKYILGIIITAIAFYNSIYIKSLEEKLAEGTVIEFDAKSYVDGIWTLNLLPTFSTATNLNNFLNQLKQNPTATFEKESKSLGIGNIGYFKVKGEGTVLQVNENNVIIQSEDLKVEIETEFIFGNVIRDASGLFKINDYKETSDFNSISESINGRIRNDIIPSFKNKVQKGDVVTFSGAIELNKVHLDLNNLEIIPITLEIKN